MSKMDSFTAHLGTVPRRLLAAIDGEFKRLGCEGYVKTIYVGWEVGGTLVAAVYPHANRVEIALALPEDHPSQLLKDGTHLTWRSLPVAVDVHLEDDFDLVSALIEEAVQRVRTGQHDTYLPVERFMKRDRKVADPTQPPGGDGSDLVQEGPTVT